MIPKPEHCGQNWLGMKPADGGRICGQCEKTIIDFSKKSWAEIERLQKEKNNMVCGMYHPRQLEHWGREIPVQQDRLLKSLTMAGLTMALALPANAQTISPADSSIVIKGKLVDENNEEIPFASVFLKTAKVNTISDVDGHFEFVLNHLPSTPLPDTLEAYCIGYRKTQVIFKDLREAGSKPGTVDRLNVILGPDNVRFTAFYVTKPTLAQRVSWKFKKWFGRKK